MCYVLKHKMHYLLLIVAVFLTACDRTQPQAQEVRYATPVIASKPLYRFAVHPLCNPVQLNEIYQPLMDYLSKHVETADFQLDIPRDIEAFAAKIRGREAAFILPNPWETLEAVRAGYNVIAVAGEDSDFKGIFLVRRDSGIKEVADVKGKVVSYPALTALASTILPQYYLHNNGIDVLKHTDSRYVGSQETSIMHVFFRKSDIGATWQVPWRLFQKSHPAEAAQLKVIWETPPLINNSVMVRDDVPQPVRDRVRKLLEELSQTPEGRNLLQNMETARFQPADNAYYEPVRKFISNFEKKVRPVERENAAI